MTKDISKLNISINKQVEENRKNMRGNANENANNAINAININNNINNDNIVKNPIQPIVNGKKLPIEMDYEFITDGLPEKFISRTIYHYVPYVIPPLPYNDILSTGYIRSNYFRDTVNRRLNCDKDICKNPLNYINQYLDLHCTDDPNTCGKIEDYIVFYEKQYTVGTLDVIKNGYIGSDYDCGWRADNERQITVTSNPEVKGKVVYLDVPEGWAFQHFTDGVLPKIVQAEKYLNDSRAKFYVPTSDKFPIVKKMLNRMGVTDDRLINIKGRISAEELVVPCVAPPTHPLLWRRAQYLLKLPFLQDGYNKEQKYIIYFSRNSGTYNGGRRVTNEDQVLNTLREYVNNHPQYELIEMIKKKLSFDETIELMSEAKVLVGPHGGAHINMIFTRPGTYTIEFIPDSNTFYSRIVYLMIYIQSNLLNHIYYNIMSQPVGGDMSVNIENLKEVLNKIN